MQPFKIIKNALLSLKKVTKLFDKKTNNLGELLHWVYILMYSHLCG